MATLRKITIVGSIGVGIAFGAVAGTFASVALANVSPAAAPSTGGPQQTPALVSESAPGQAHQDVFPTNEYGQTYGGSFGMDWDHIPDLVRVISNEGLIGYVPREVLFALPNVSLEANINSASSAGQVIEVTESDGKTVIGTFTLE